MLSDGTGRDGMGRGGTRTTFCAIWPQSERDAGLKGLIRRPREALGLLSSRAPQAVQLRLIPSLSHTHSHIHRAGATLSSPLLSSVYLLHTLASHLVSSLVSSARALFEVEHMGLLTRLESRRLCATAQHTDLTEGGAT